MPAGVPSLLVPTTGQAPQPLMTADSPSIQPTSRVPAWGIYWQGALAIEVDSILKVEYKGSARISNAPQEKGAFQAYNKVQAPYESRVMLTKGGSESDRAFFLNAIEAAKQSLNLYDIVMPEKSYLNASITGYSFSRSASQGVTLLRVELIFEEVRQASDPVFTATTGGSSPAAPVATIPNPKKPSGADLVNAGAVQAGPPTKAQAQAIIDALQPNFSNFLGN